MNLKALIATAAACGVAFGGVATAEAKPHEKKLKDCKQTGKANKLHCQTQGGKDVTAACSSDYEAIQLIQLPPGNEVYDVNGNYVVCWSSELGVTDDVVAS